MSNIENFEIRPAYRRLLDFWVVMMCLGIFLVLLVSFQIPFSDEPGKRTLEVGGAILVAAIFVSLALYLRRTKHLFADHSISIDPEGIWLTHRPRATSLVPWSQIVQVRERTQLQRLELLDDFGQTRIRVNYQLDRFLFLRELILTRAALKLPKDRCFKRGWLYHLVNNAVFAMLLGAAFASGSWSSAILLGLLFVGFFTFLYLLVVCRIEIHKNHLVVGWPLRSRIVRRGEISAINMESRRFRGGCWFFVEIYLKGAKRPLKLEALSDPMQLRNVLRHWRVRSD